MVKRFGIEDEDRCLMEVKHQPGLSLLRGSGNPLDGSLGDLARHQHLESHRENEQRKMGFDIEFLSSRTLFGKIISSSTSNVMLP